MNTKVLASFVFVAGLVGCYTGASLGVDTDTGSALPGASKGTTVGANSGLPCDVAQVVTDSCASCHGTTPRGGAKTSLVTIEGFQAKSDKDPSKSVGQLAVERMKDAADPMPTDKLLPADKVAIVETWVNAGMPRGTCENITEPPPDPFFDKVVACSSGSMSRVREGVTMKPGQACNECHAQKRERVYTFAGTVYPTGHEDDLCNGVNGTTAGVSIVVTDVAGATLGTIPVNSAGNFASNLRVSGAYRVKVVQNGKERAMRAMPSSGDCNSCHTKDGAEGAPGRIALPE